MTNVIKTNTVAMPTISIKIGYTKLDVIFALISSSFSLKLASRLKVSSKTPPLSPVRTILIYNGEKILGYLRNESDNVFPSFIWLSKYKIIFFKLGFKVCS